jgi:glycyl-tRNA synthetase alpha subunit
LGQAIVTSTLSFIIERILRFKDNKDNLTDVALTELDEDTKTLLTLLNGVPEEQSKYNL